MYVHAVDVVLIWCSLVTPADACPFSPRVGIHIIRSKKSDRGGNAFPKIGCTESFRWDNSEVSR